MTPHTEFEDTRDHEVPGRRHEDGVLRLNFNPKRALIWVGLASGVIGLSTWAISAVAGQIVTPPALKAVTDSVATVRTQQEATTASMVRLNVRVDSLRDRLKRVEDFAEIVVIDICLRRRGDPYAVRRLNCTEYLDGK